MIFRLKLFAGFDHLTGASHRGSIVPEVEAQGSTRRPGINRVMKGQLTGAWPVLPNQRPDQQRQGHQ